ncbi:MAG: TIGR02996 domain-containing protein [Deltaproteobacteria bacterium]|nr:TIGR02996 domain-containing protein [Deltaproteobacteria bacterium]
MSKAVFEKVAGKSPSVGARLRMDRYVSGNKALEPLSNGGKLYLVTVRPPDEALWLVAVLEKPKFDGEQWLAKPCDTPITDISDLRGEIKFASGVGITAKKGALGMSLQTPRALTDEDVELLDGAAGGGGDADGDGDAKPAKKGAGKPGKPLPPPPAAIISQSLERKNLLLQAVASDPDSDDPRRVYADQLTTKNDPRGEFILVDIALAGPLSIRKREALAARRAELMAKHGKTWFNFAGLTARVSRGFVESIGGKIGKLLKTAPEIFESEPVSEVSIREIDDETIDKLLAAPWLPHVRRLVLRGKLDDESFGKLVTSPSLAKLTTLNVTGTKVSADALGYLDGNLANVRTLVLTGNKFGDDGIEKLVAWKHLPGLETLYASGCDLSSKGVAALLGVALGKLDKLTFTNNDIGDKGLTQIVANAKNLPLLSYLELVNTDISKNGVKALVKAKLPALRRIDVRQNGISEDFAAEEDARLRAGK